MAAKTIKIAVLVGDNGAFSCNPFAGDNTDWAFMSDCIGAVDEKTKDMIYPEIERRYVVTATVELPSVEPKAVMASRVEPAK